MAEALGLALECRQTGSIPLDACIYCGNAEVLAIVGPSGSGKSTLLRTIAGLYKPSEGVVRVAGETWFDAQKGVNLPPHRRAVGFVFQDYALFPHMTARQNLESAMGDLPSNQRTAYARQLFESVNLRGFEQRLPSELSGGQQQRVAVARALARRPKVLLLDEPFSAVDKMTREKLFLELSIIRRSLSIPLVLVTHDLTEAMALSDKITLLHHGRVLQSAAPVEVTTRPVSAEAARLVGLTNIFDGIVVGHQPFEQSTLIKWQEQTLRARYCSAYGIGDRVSWVIPPGKVLLMPHGRSFHSTQENIVCGTVITLMPLSDRVHMTMRLYADKERTLRLSLSPHACSRSKLVVGGQITVSLLHEGIHLMPWQEAEDFL